MKDLETRTINRILRLTQAEIPAFLNDQQLTPALFTKMAREYKHLRNFVSKHGQMPSRSLFLRIS